MEDIGTVVDRVIAQVFAAAVKRGSLDFIEASALAGRRIDKTSDKERVAPSIGSTPGPVRGVSGQESPLPVDLVSNLARKRVPMRNDVGQPLGSAPSVERLRWLN